MSLAVGLAGALAIVSAARAEPPLQLAMAELGPTVSHDEMTARVGSGLFDFFSVLSSINPTAGPATGTPLGESNMAVDVGKGGGGGLRYLCPDRLYKDNTLQVNKHIYAECSNGGVADILPRDNTQLLAFAKFAPDPTPPGGSTTPLPCGGNGFALSIISVMNNIRTSSNTNH
jgi:hypothetical protein